VGAHSPTRSEQRIHPAGSRPLPKAPGGGALHALESSSDEPLAPTSTVGGPPTGGRERRLLQGSCSPPLESGRTEAKEKRMAKTPPEASDEVAARRGTRREGRVHEEGGSPSPGDTAAIAYRERRSPSRIPGSGSSCSCSVRHGSAATPPPAWPSKIPAKKVVRSELQAAKDAILGGEEVGSLGGGAYV